MAIPKSYKNNIAEGKGILVFSIVCAVIIRFVYYGWGGEPSVDWSDSPIGTLLFNLFSNSFISFIASGISVVCLALLAAYINTTNLLIRRRTLLPSAIIILLFSCHPSFIYMSPQYFGVLAVMYVISLLFVSYNATNKSIAAFASGFVLAVGSLFSPVLILYYLVLWLGLALMRCFSLKSFLATILSCVMVYFPVYSIFLFVGELNTLYDCFSSFAVVQLLDFPVLDFSISQWAIILCFFLVFGIIMADNYVNRYKDKIKVRAYLSLLALFVSVGFLLFALLNITPLMSLYVVLAAGALLLGHFFALAEQKVTTMLFYFLGVVYLFICFLPFLSF
ncbi:MAG: hypothetical protein E6767_04170 [Dysgonomonas sp.]|nr:hypothetical protein [Dysgonomonas sp.]